MVSKEEIGLVHYLRMSGISGVLVTPFTPEQCLATLLLVAWEFLDPSSLMDWEVGSARGSSQIITPAEAQVVALLEEGLLYKEMTSRLSISAARLKKLQHRAFRKLGAGTRAEAVRR